LVSEHQNVSKFLFLFHNFWVTSKYVQERRIFQILSHNNQRITNENIQHTIHTNIFKRSSLSLLSCVQSIFWSHSTLWYTLLNFSYFVLICDFVFQGLLSNLVSLKLEGNNLAFVPIILHSYPYRYDSLIQNSSIKFPPNEADQLTEFIEVYEDLYCTL
jgi:hypothetical protein